MFITPGSRGGRRRAQRGIVTPTAARAGEIGEIISSTVLTASAVSLTTNTAKTVTSIALTPGDWDIHGSLYFNAGGTTVVTSTALSLNLADNGFTNPATGIGETFVQQLGFSSTGAGPSLGAGPARQIVSVNTTYYLVAFATFTTSTLAAYGSLWARRRR